MSAPKVSTVRNKHSTSQPINSKYGADRIDVTKEEFQRISEALKKEEFRKLFVDYCEEIQDPANRKRYEEEIVQLEAERGVDVKFINPEPGFVIKTAVNGASKCFINVAKSPEVAKPTSQMQCDPQTGKRGLNWSLPLAQSGPRDDLDAQNKRCIVYDVVFHPDTLHLAERNKMFNKCLIDTALDAVERAYEVKLDRTNLKFPKLSFKGIARPTVIRKLSKNPLPETDEPHPLEDIYPAKPTADSEEPQKLPIKVGLSKKPEFNTPQYTIKHRRDLDLAEFTYEVDAKLNATMPHEIVVEIELPLLKSTAECQLDVTSQSLYLLSERAGARYRLHLDLPYKVDDKQGSARFDSDTRRLIVTLPVEKMNSVEQRQMHDTLLNLNSREDSGVESDVREEGISSPRQSSVEELNKSSEMDNKTTSNTLASTKSDTDEAPETETKEFLEEKIPYKFPTKFDCNGLDNLLSLVLHVPHVQSESIGVLQLEHSVHVRFASIGSGYFPTHYAFYFGLPETANVVIESAAAEAWENNVVLSLSLAHSEANESTSTACCHTYLAGLNKDNVQEYSLLDQFKTQPVLRKKNAALLKVSVERLTVDSEQTVEIEIKPSTEPTGEECDDEEQCKSGMKKQPRKKNKKRRSFSESTCDDVNKAYRQQQHELSEQRVLDENEQSKKQAQEKKQPIKVESEADNGRAISDNVNINGQQRKMRSFSECRGDSVASSNGGGNTLPTCFKGILKHWSRYDQRPSISDSYSSMDEYSSYGGSVDTGIGGCCSLAKSCSECIPEEDSFEPSMSESCKKTVRFNDIIKKQVFRMDSSILGQRKKNQKCRNRKQRALQRRLSEGDSADYEENNVQNNTNNNNNKGNCKTPNVKQNNRNNCKCDPNKKPRARIESESSSDVDTTKNSMMFEIEM